MISERVVLLVGFVLLIGLAVLTVRLWIRARDRRRQAAPVEPLWDALDARPDGRPTVVAFSTPSCLACKSAQLPALNALVEQLGPEAVRVIQIDATIQPSVAEKFGILTVPTTVILAQSGQVATTNNGFAPVDRLAQQVQAASAR
jgi:thiol-disulfide isomerase/thioredoxin